MILQDIEKEIKSKHLEGYEIVLYGDLNEDIEKSDRVEEFLENSGLKKIMTTKHKGEVLPKPYDRGSKCLNIMAISNTIDEKAIVRCDILPFYHGMPSDHCSLYVDLDTEYLFTNTHVDRTNANYKRFTTSQPKKCNKYLHTLERLMEENRIFKKVNKLEQEMKEYLEEKTGDIDNMIKRCKILFQKTSEQMISSNKKAGRAHYRDGKPSSPILAEAAEDVIEIRNELRQESTTDKDTLRIQELKIFLKEAKREFKKIQQHANEHREKHLQDLYSKKAKD